MNPSFVWKETSSLSRYPAPSPKDERCQFLGSGFAPGRLVG